MDALERANKELEEYVGGTLWDELTADGSVTFVAMAETCIKAGYRHKDGRRMEPKELLADNGTGELAPLIWKFYEGVHRLQRCRDNEGIRLYQ